MTASAPALEADRPAATCELASLLDGLVDGFYALDDRFRFTQFNRVAEQHFGVRRAEVLGRWVFEIFPQGLGSRFESCFREVLETGRPAAFETASIVRADSFVEFRVFPANGGVAISFRNVTPARRAEMALGESQARLAIATKAADLGIWDWDVSSGAIAYSDRAKAIYGLPPGEPVTFEQVRAATHPEDLPRTSAMARRALDPAIREKEPYEYRVIRPDDGRTRWILAHGEAVFARVAGAERAVRYVGTIQDITERKLAEEAVAASERRLRLAVDAARMAVWAYDVAADTVEGSPELNRLLGFPDDASPSLEEMRARYYPGEQVRLRAIADEALAQGERYLRAEYRCLWPDGSVRWLLLRAEFVLDGEGRPASVVGVLLDITDRKLIEEQRELLINELNHRVKNTLATVQSVASQTLRNAGTLEEARSAFEERLIGLSRAHDVLTRENWEGAALDEIVGQAVVPYAPEGTAPEQAERLALSGPATRLSPRQALALAMALQELSTNAVKYGAWSNETGRVEIAWTVQNQEGAPVLRLRWQESGGPAVSAPQRRGFGSRLIERSLAQDLGGTARIAFETDGVSCTVEAPLT